MPRSRRLRGGVCLAAAVALAATLGGTASAHDGISSDDGGIDNAGATHGHDVHGQHGGSEDHLPPSVENVELVSRLELRNVVPGKIADVGVHNGYAYLAAWGGETCEPNGVHVVDVRDPAAPREVAFVPSKEGSYPGEGVQALAVDTPKFTGDILVTNNEICRAGVGVGGLNIYNVTNPARPTPLAVGIGDENVPGQGKKAVNQIHSVFAWDAGANAYAVIVDNEEGKDVDILDITDPKKPRVIAEYDLDEQFPRIVQATPDNLVEVFHHDVIVKEINGRQVMLVSYWDGGYVQLDVTNPRAAFYLADTDFAAEDPELPGVAPEGNAHQAEFTADNAYVIAADEDFNPYGLVARNDTHGVEIPAGQGDGTTPLEPGQTITGQSKFVGRACNADPAVPAGDGTQVAVVERGLCTFTEKVANVIAAGGYSAVLIFNRVGSDACNQTLGMSVAGDIPTFGVAPRGAGFDLFDQPYDDAACLALPADSQQSGIPLGATGDTLTFSSFFDGWGYVHLYSNGGGKLAELDTYAVDQAHDPEFATGSGDLSVHEVAVSPTRADLAYISYYAAGLRVVSVEDGEIVEVGNYIDPEGNNFWGVQVFEVGGVEYVAASDRDHGLFIFRYTGP
ncbi:MAG TPA: PA domain-containing protein [Pseudonocardia sp.]|nr:PA domain-containing protein [Pseudonocardia sp.]